MHARSPILGGFTRAVCLVSVASATGSRCAKRAAILTPPLRAVPLSPHMICRQCQRENPPQNAFCHACGAPMGGQNGPSGRALPRRRLRRALRAVRDAAATTRETCSSAEPAASTLQRTVRRRRRRVAAEREPIASTPATQARLVARSAPGGRTELRDDGGLPAMRRPERCRGALLQVLRLPLRWGGSAAAGTGGCRATSGGRARAPFTS